MEKFVWTSDTLNTVYYASRDYEPVALRIYAKNPPGGDMVVDILDDGVSIMNSNDSTKLTFVKADGYLNVHTKSGAFTVHEQITGGTSSASAFIKADDGYGKLTLRNASGIFTAGETVTGASSTSTAVVDAYVREQNGVTETVVSGQSNAKLGKGQTSSTAAQDFIDNVQIDEGSWVSFSVLDFAGAGDFTIQLDLMPLGENSESQYN